MFDNKKISGDLTTFPKESTKALIEATSGVFVFINDIIMSITQIAHNEHEIDPQLSRVTLLFSQQAEQQYKKGLQHLKNAENMAETDDFSITDAITEISKAEEHIMPLVNTLSAPQAEDEDFADMELEDTIVYETEDDIFFDEASYEDDEDVYKQELLGIIADFSTDLSYSIKYTYLPTIRRIMQKDPAQAIRFLHNIFQHIKDNFPQIHDLYPAQQSVSAKKNIQTMRNILANDGDIFDQVDELMQIIVNNNNLLLDALALKAQYAK